MRKLNPSTDSVRASYPPGPGQATDPERVALDVLAGLETPRRTNVGTISLLVAVGGAVACHAAIVAGAVADTRWLHVVADGFEAGVIGGLADWFAVTALFRHPLGLPIPHTAIIPRRRAKIIESIVTMVERDWLSPDVIGARLARFSPSDLLADWFADAAHVERLAHPLRDLVRGLVAGVASEDGVAFLVETFRQQLRDAPVDVTSGRLLARVLATEHAEAAFTAVATSIANVAERPRTAVQLHWWLDRSAATLREQGRRMLPFLLRRRVVQRAVVQAACGYAAAELRSAAAEPGHPVRELVLRSLRRFADRLAAGDPDTLAEVDRWRQTVADAADLEPLVRHTIERLRAQVDRDLADPESRLARLLHRELRDAVLTLLDDPDRRARFDRWVRTTADDLLRRHHDQIGLTVRENLEALDTGALVAQIEGRVGADLQYIRLNGAVVGGLIGLALSLLRLLAA